MDKALGFEPRDCGFESRHDLKLILSKLFAIFTIPNIFEFPQKKLNDVRDLEKQWFLNSLTRENASFKVNCHNRFAPTDVLLEKPTILQEP